MKQHAMTLDQAKDLVKQLGFARLLEQRARPLHPHEPAPKKPRATRLPRVWRGREAQLHAELNDSVLPVLKAALTESLIAAERDELDLMIKFAKVVKCRIKPQLKVSDVSAEQDAA